METPARERLERWVAKLELEYRWAQRDDAVVVTLPLPKDATKAQVEVTIKADRLVAGLQGREPSVSGNLFAPINPEDSLWTIEQDGSVRALVICLEKADPKVPWPMLMRDGPLEQLDALSVCHLGTYREAQGNYEGALECYFAAAERGNTDAMLRLAYIYSTGREQSAFPVDLDAAKAYQYNLAAAEHDCVEAMYFVGRSLQYGVGVDFDHVKAASWYELAIQMMAFSGQSGPLFVLALFDLGVLHHHGMHGLERNIKTALTMWAVADRHGSAEAAYNIAVCYIKGDGVDSSYSDAVMYFQRAASRDPKITVPSRADINLVRSKAGLAPFPEEEEEPVAATASPAATPVKRVHFSPDTRDPAQAQTPPQTPSAHKPARASSLRNVVSASPTKEKRKGKARAEAGGIFGWSWGDALLIGAAALAVAVAFTVVRSRR